MTFESEKTAPAVTGVDAPSVRSLTSLDWGLLAVALLAIGLLVIVPLLLQPHWLQMFRDFGSDAALPPFTRFALSPWFGPTLALPGFVALVGALCVRRRGWVVATLVACSLASAAGLTSFFVAMYLPIFRLAEQIKSP